MSEEAIYERIGASLDRFQETHFWLHMIEQYYHAADPFRWHLNAFLRALKEVPQLLQMELQNEPGFKGWFSSQRAALKADPLIRVLSGHRDFVVHRGMLLPKSTAFVGITEGRGMKLGMTFPVRALEDSDNGMRRYLAVSKMRGDILGILIPDEDSVPCVQRQWRLSVFEDEIGEVCARAWLRLGETVAAVLSWLGYTGSSGEAESILMMLDPSPSGAYDPTEVIAAWNYFSNKPGMADGSTIHVVGFVAVPPGGTAELLHVVRA